MKEKVHEPVLVDQVKKFLVTGPGLLIVDCTVGWAGHAEAILSSRFGPGQESVKLLIGIDQDPEAIAAASERLSKFESRLILKKANFEDLKEVLEEEGMEKVDGILLDLGASRHQLTAGYRGFSLMADGKLDMRMDQGAGESAADLIARLDEKELASIIIDYGEERFAKRIAREIVKKRREGSPVKTTAQLAGLVEKVVPKSRGGRLHPATKTFMALRLAVNNELARLENALDIIPDCLSPEGRVAAVSYHSLEDRMVKQAFKREAKGCVCPPDSPRCVCGRKPRLLVLTKKAIKPSPDEVSGNPAARSARLRAAQRLGESP
jgi:16S rRNA (cytosine1402-N4)-methyltransferase